MPLSLNVFYPKSLPKFLRWIASRVESIGWGRVPVPWLACSPRPAVALWRGPTTWMCPYFNSLDSTPPVLYSSSSSRRVVQL